MDSSLGKAPRESLKMTPFFEGGQHKEIADSSAGERKRTTTHGM